METPWTVLLCAARVEKEEKRRDVKDEFEMAGRVPEETQIG